MRDSAPAWLLRASSRAHLRTPGATQRLALYINFFGPDYQAERLDSTPPTIQPGRTLFPARDDLERRENQWLTRPRSTSKELRDNTMTIQIPIGSPAAWVRGAVFVSMLVSAGAADAAGPFRPFQFGHWSGGAYTNDQTGAFSHCAAAVPYVSGVLMFASVNRYFGWSLAFSHSQWALTPKTQIPIELHFDGGPAFNVFGVVLAPIMVEVPMPDNSKLINTFRSSFADGRSGTRAVLSVQLEWHIENNGRVSELRQDSAGT